MINIKKKNIGIIVLSIVLGISMYPTALITITDFTRDAYFLIKIRSVSSNSGNIEDIDVNRTRIVFMFDDGWESVYQKAYPILDRYDYKGSIPLIPSLVGEYEYMSFEQIARLYLQGWDIQNHSYTHSENLIEKQELLLDINKARKWISNRFIGSYKDKVVMPYGKVSEELIQLLKEDGYHSVRKYNEIIVFERNQIKEYPAIFINLLTDFTVNEVKDIIMETFEDPTTIVLILHKISEIDEGYGMTYSERKLEEIVSFINEHSDRLQVVTYSQLFN